MEFNKNYRALIPSKNYYVLKNKNEVVNKERLSVANEGAVWISKWRFEKRSSYRDWSNKNIHTIPDTEILFLITKFKGSVWLNARELNALYGMIEAQKELIGGLEGGLNA